jgi:hypothetical protein
MLGIGKRKCKMIKKRALLTYSFICFLIGLNYAQGRIIDQVKIRADDADKERFDRVAIDLKTDHWLETPSGIESELYSIGISAYLYKDIPLSKKSNFSIAYGIGLSSDNIHHNGTFITSTNTPNNNSFTELTPYNGLKYRINKITLNYIEIPFELRFRTMNKSLEERRRFNFRLYPGFKAGYLMGNHTKFVSDQSKIKVYRTPNTLFYRYGPTLRIGFNKISFIAFYSLTGIFEEGKGSELNTFSVGVSWLRF